MRFALVVCVAACTSSREAAKPKTIAVAPAAPVPSSPPEPTIQKLPLEVKLDAKRALDDDMRYRWTFHARAADGAIGGYGIPVSGVVNLVAVEADRFRVVVEHDRTRLLVWVPRGAFLPVVTRTTGTAQKPLGRIILSYEPGVFVLPGTVVTEWRENWGHLRASGGLEIDAWIPPDAIADWYSDGPPDNPMTDDENSFSSFRAWARDFIPPGTRVHVNQHADGLVVAVATQQQNIEYIGGRSDDVWREIEIESYEARVRGFVRTSEIQVPPGSSGFGSSSGRFGTIGAGRVREVKPPPVVNKGTCIVDETGARVGVVIHDIAEPMRKAADGRLMYPAPREGLFFAKCP